MHYNSIRYQPGQIISGLVFIKEVEPYLYPNGRGKRKAIFKCYCGNEFEAQIMFVKNKHTQSCGCYQKAKTREACTKHSYNIRGNRHPLYGVWSNMKVRCYHEKGDDYKNYGGRGIKVCNEWICNPEVFIRWALANGYKKGLTIDRYPDNDGDYEPSNCRFVTNAENARNRSTTKLNWNSVNKIRGIKLFAPKTTQKEIANIFGVHRATINNVLNNKTWVVI